MADRTKWVTSKQRWMRCVLYPESQMEAIEYIKTNWPCMWVLHDKDVNENGEPLKPHVHFLMHFVNPRYPQAVIKKLPGVEIGALRSVDQPYEAEKYMTHESSHCEGKYLYSRDEVHIENDYEWAMENEGISEDVAANEMFLLMYEASSWTAFCQLCLAKGYWATLRRSSYLWHSLYKDLVRNVEKAEYHENVYEE